MTDLAKYDPLVGTFLPEDFAVDLYGFWSEITAPTLLCWGTESWTSNPATDGRVAYFRDHRTVVFEQAGHWRAPRSVGCLYRQA